MLQLSVLFLDLEFKSACASQTDLIAVDVEQQRPFPLEGCAVDIFSGAAPALVAFFAHVCLQSLWPCLCAILEDSPAPSARSVLFPLAKMMLFKEFVFEQVNPSHALH